MQADALLVTHVDGPNGKLAIEDVGPRDDYPTPVVLVHSFGGNIGHWSNVLDHLRPTRRTIALDWRGSGQSDLPRDGNFAIEAIATDIGTVIDALEIDRVVLVGHSQGALASLAYAAANPKRVAGLLLVEAPPDPAGLPPEARRQLDDYIAGVKTDRIDSVSEAYVRQIGGSNARVVDRLIQDLRATPRVTVANGGATSIVRYDPKGDIARYRGPIRAIVTSVNDTPISVHHLRPGVPRDVVPGTGHWLHLEKPEEFNRLLDGFLAAIDTDRPRR